MSVATITVEGLRGLIDFETQQKRVEDALIAALAEAESRVRFLARYASWNGFFGSGVAALAGKLGRCRGLFLDPMQPVQALADRSVYVASYFFDAARDEFDDRDTVHRDTHRCLAQSMLKALVDYEIGRGAQALAEVEYLNRLTADPDWLSLLNQRVAQGYGAMSPDDRPAAFQAIGYHLGSELLADREFSIIDQRLRQDAAPLVEYLSKTTVEIAGQAHRAYQWIAIHSGHGGGAEADHFDWALQGVRLAFRFTPEDAHAEARLALEQGFRRFAADHRRFFEQVH